MRTRFLAALLAVASVAAHAQLPADQQAKIADIATKVLKDTGVPSASIAIAYDGKLAYTGAFGLADVATHKPATPAMAYPIGSISKQFTAQALLLLQQRGKLSIDDPVSKYFPNFTRANEVTLRNLMTMTSGYEDFAPQDYIIPEWRKDTDPLANATKWATKPLDFEPGTEWQYSNTNYVILGLIVQKVSGEPLMKFLRDNEFKPLHLEGIFDTYDEREKLQALGYVSNATAPVRVQPLEGRGWYFGDGALSMPASTLVQWDLAIADHKLLSPESYKQFETPFTFNSGKPSNYALGTYAIDVNGHLMLEHGGEVGGYVAENIVFPNDKIAVVVLTNQVASSAASTIAKQIVATIFPAAKRTAAGSTGDPVTEKLRAELLLLQQGKVDPASLTADTIDYFTPEALQDFQSTLAPLGTLQSLTRNYSHERGGMTGSGWTAKFEHGSVNVSTYLTRDGKFEQLLVTGKG